jgi:hypothetical protein
VQFGEAVFGANNRNYETAESFLSGQVLYDDKPLDDTYYSKYEYSKGAVSVTPLKLGSRDFDFTMVVGPGGSGKTMFALRRLPSLIFKGGENTILRVHFRWDMKTRMVYSIPSFPDAVAAYAERCITAKLSRSSLTNVTNVKLGLHVILDDAGSRFCKDYFDSASKITDIVDALRDKMLYKFKNRVHVTLVGTGLELSTLAIDSKAETTKFRMLPWTLKNFENMADVSDHPEKYCVKKVVRNFPILMSLVTNAGCADTLLRNAMPKERYFLETYRIRSSLNGIISKVAYHYKIFDELSSVNPKQKWAVVRSVFRQIDYATSHPNVAFFPRFDDLDPYFQSIALSMVDIQVESEHGLPVLRGNTYSVSLSPAVFIVLATLLNADTEASWDWQTLQSSVALGAWKRMIVNSQDTPTDDDKTIVQMPYPVPTNTDAKKTMIIPKMNQFMVILNGLGASYADVMAPFRLMRVKFKGTTATTHQILDLQSELDKMGLTNSSKHTKQQAFTSVLYQGWNSTERAPSTMKVVEKQLANRQERGKYFPSDKLVSGYPYESPSVVKCQIHDGFVTMGKRRIESMVAFEESHPVTAVFATNCNAFVLQGKKTLQSTRTTSDASSQEESDATENFRIFWNDVDGQGKLISKILPNDTVFGLREHVEIRFLFVTS